MGAECGKHIDERIRNAVNGFMQQSQLLETAGVKDEKRIRTAFLGKYLDDDPKRAPEIEELARAAAIELEGFNRTLASISIRLSNLLLAKDLFVMSSSLALAQTGKTSAEAMLKTLEQVSEFTKWVNAARDGRDPGPMPEITAPSENHTLFEMEAAFEKACTKGEEVAALIDVLSGIITTRLAYLRGFKLANLDLDPVETVERIAERLKRAPSQTTSDVILELMKGSIRAILMDAVDKIVPLSTISDLANRMHIAAIGRRPSTEPTGVDEIYGLRHELREQQKAVDLAFRHCDWLIGDLLNAAK